MTLTDILKNRSCFKLVCGAGNENPKEVEKLVTVYAKAGANYFDLSANVEVVKAARRGIERVIPAKERENYFLNVSVGIKGDPHIRKAKIDEDLCIGCGECEPKCLQRAIRPKGSKYTVINEDCIGCGACDGVCPVNAISFFSVQRDLKDVLPPLISLGLASLELHAVTDDEDGAFKQWEEMNKLFNGPMSLCLDRSHLGDKQLISRIKRFLAIRNGRETIIQADGAPMSGSDDKPNTTLQALATADVVQKSKLPILIMLSGGTNSRTTELAKLFELDFHAVAIGSYARKIIKQYIELPDFLENEQAFNNAYKIAKDLVDKTLKYMNK